MAWESHFHRASSSGFNIENAPRKIRRPVSREVSADGRSANNNTRASGELVACVPIEFVWVFLGQRRLSGRP